MLISDEDDVDVSICSCVGIGVVDTEFSMFVVGAMTAITLILIICKKTPKGAKCTKHTLVIHFQLPKNTEK